MALSLSHLFNRIKVAEAEKKKAEAHAEHQRKAHIFNKYDLEVEPTVFWFLIHAF